LVWCQHSLVVAHGYIGKCIGSNLQELDAFELMYFQSLKKIMQVFLCVIVVFTRFVKCVYQSLL